jgi:hypothetical protein
MRTVVRYAMLTFIALCILYLLASFPLEPLVFVYQEL